MASLSVWLFIFGGTLVVLGIFLLVSDRKFGRQQRQAARRSPNHQISQARRSQTSLSAAWMTTKKELVEKISSVSTRREERDKNIAELQSEQGELAAVRSENHDLQGKNANLKKQLHTTEAKLGEATREVREIGHRNSRLQSELVEFKRQAQAKQKTIEELRTEQQRLLDSQSENQNSREQLEAAREQLSATEAANEALRAANKLLREEITALKDHQPADVVFGNQPEQTRAQPAMEQREPSAKKEQLETVMATRSPGERKWRFGIFQTTAGIAVLTAMTIGFVSTSSDRSFGSKESVAAQEQSRIETVSDGPQGSYPSMAPQTKTAVQVARAAPRLKGTFKTIRATELFTGPTEESALIATIGPGATIHVVDSRDGWLQIRSAQPRRSGFVRQESSVKTDDN